MDSLLTQQVSRFLTHAKLLVPSGNVPNLHPTGLPSSSNRPQFMTARSLAPAQKAFPRSGMPGTPEELQAVSDLLASCSGSVRTIDWSPLAAQLERSPASLYPYYLAATRKARGALGKGAGYRRRDGGFFDQVAEPIPPPVLRDNGRSTFQRGAGKFVGGELRF